MLDKMHVVRRATRYARSIRDKRSGAGLAAIALILLCLAAYFPFVPARFGDFRAFYCSGRAVLVQRDPYREHPLRDCERSVQAPGVSVLRDSVAIPAPFPGYVLGFFALIALLPFGAAAGLWLTGSLIALGCSVALIARSAEVRIAAVAVAIGFPMVVAAIRVGQATPFIAFGLAMTACYLRRGQPRRAALAALGVAFEPHIALALFVALFIGERRTRLPLFVGSVVLAGISLAVLGPELNIEYLQAVLPAHALVNVPDLTQFSVAHLAYVAGMDAGRARVLGGLWYGAAAALGVYFALKLRKHYGVAALVFVPPAFEVFGGVYIHITQMALAIPAFLILAGHATRMRTALVAAVFFAAIPWMMIANFPMLVTAIAIVGIAFAIALDVENLAVPLAISASLVMLALFGTSFVGVNQHVSSTVSIRSLGNPLAEVSWGAAMVQRGGSTVAWFVAAKIPTLAAFTLLLVALGYAATCTPPTRVPMGRSPAQRKIGKALADT